METRAIPPWELRRPRLSFPVSRLGDEALARLVERGEERVFAVLFDRYHQTLYRYCRSIVRSEPDAEDVVQSVFASAFVALRDRRRDAPLKPWLFRIAHNESISVLRRRRPDAELTDGMVAAALPVEDTALQRERLARLVADVLVLPERQRAALVMRELSGLSHEEIAVALECSAGAAKQTIFEARQALAELEEGRAMSCDEICRKISDGDRRALRGRKVRAHLQGCAACATFAEAIPARTAELRALAPVLPSGATAMLLARTLRRAAGADPGRLTAGAVGKAAAGVTSAKLTAGAVLLATATVGVADLREHQRPSAPTRPVVTSAVVTSAAAVAATESAARTGGAAAIGRGAGAPGVRRFSLHGHRGHGRGTAVARTSGVPGAATPSVRATGGGRGVKTIPGGRVASAGHGRAGSAGHGRVAGAGHGLAVGRTRTVPPGAGLQRARAPSTSRAAAAGGARSPTRGGSHASAHGASGSAHTASGSAHGASAPAHASPHGRPAVRGATAGQTGTGNPHAGT
jgi:RNA polymerase sigma factor (sigma-70 family)